MTQHTIRVILAGPPQSGKTSLFRVWDEDDETVTRTAPLSQVTARYVETCRLNESLETFPVVPVQLWDAVSMSWFSLSSQLRGAEGAVLLCPANATSEWSSNLEAALKFRKEQLGLIPWVVMASSKCDAMSNEAAQWWALHCEESGSQERLKFCRRHKLLDVVSTSSRNRLNVREVIALLCDAMFAVPQPGAPIRSAVLGLAAPAVVAATRLPTSLGSLPRRVESVVSSAT
jgi:hypothetical protein